ncbi:F-box only protein 21 [Picochlorum sp. SENEW3]|nr:F-box only protein 21 [Picochlorum sp. SENEW3]
MIPLLHAPVSRGGCRHTLGRPSITSDTSRRRKSKCFRRVLKQNRVHGRLHAHDQGDALSVGDQMLNVEFRLQQLQLRLQRAKAREDFETASLLRDQISHTQLQLRKIQIDREHEIIRYDIGNVIEHKRYGYRGIIMGYTATCEASRSWVSMMNVAALERGLNQPFYHVLVDSRDRPGGQTTYVAEENIMIRPWCEISHPLVDKYFISTTEGEHHMPEYKPSAELRGIFLKDL